METQRVDPSTTPREWNTRRQALNACETCRQRKQKCDEERPRCGRCERLRLNCVYLGSGSKRESSLSQFQESLNRIESKLDGLHKATGSLSSKRASDIEVPWNPELRTFYSHNLVSSGQANEDSIGTDGSSLAASYSLFPSKASPSLETTENINDKDFVLAIPFRHTTAPQNILSWPCVLTTPITPDPSYAMRLELARSKPSRSKLPPICLKGDVDGVSWLDRMTLPQIRLLSRRYFEDFCPQAPIITLKYFQEQILGPVLHDGFSSNLQTCILLLVCALGSVSAVDRGDIEWRTEQNEQQGSAFTDKYDVGLGFFNLANEILQGQPELSWKSCQAHLLAGIYQSHQLRLYEHWQAVHQASMAIMILLQNNSRLSRLQSQIYWVTYLQESQILAELEFPPSGISRYENFVPLPFRDTDNESESNSVYDFIFLAEIALRRLLNRVHFNIYNFVDDTQTSAAQPPSLNRFSSTSMMAISPTMIYELDHQLETWRSHLPPRLFFEGIESLTHWEYSRMVKPQQRAVGDKLLGFMKARYCAGKAIIHRFFAYKIIHNQDGGIGEGDIRGASICLQAAFHGVLTAGILSDNFGLMQSPINPCRSFFATAMLLKLVSMNKYGNSVLPKGWEIICDIQRRLEIEIAPISPIVAEDMQILRRLDEMIVNNHGMIHNTNSIVADLLAEKHLAPINADNCVVLVVDEESSVAT